ncbi:Ankyrin repeat domain-containing protein [Plasmodiophora brassicae]|uniref:Uncharacterized protein n=1 Tax=Plasmodiophora brassicae TaxID=37360 RepID=A0A0G4J403_PLABS|nr:hypothetical protein PBRA_008874 [Plasmodiophora brassicae]
MTIGKRAGHVRPCTWLGQVLIVALGLLCGQIGAVITISRYDYNFDVHEPDVDGVNQLLDATGGQQHLLDVVRWICHARLRGTPLDPMYGFSSVHETEWPGGAGNVVLWAAINRQHAVLRLLVQVPDIVVNCRDGQEWTPLHYAASNGDITSVGILLGCPSASLEFIVARDPQDRTPLDLAAQLGHVDVVLALIEYTDSQGQRIQVSHRSRLPVTPLHLATANGHTGVVRLLLESGRVFNRDWNRAQKMALDTNLPDELLSLFRLIRR